MTLYPTEHDVRVLRTRERLRQLYREADTARLLRLLPARAWHWRLLGWSLRLERLAGQPAVG